MKTNGQIAYEAYCGFTNWKSLVSGQPLPQWQDTKPEIRAAWEKAAEAIIVHKQAGSHPRNASRTVVGRVKINRSTGEIVGE